MFSNLFQRVLFGETKGLQVESLEVEADQIEVVAVRILSEAQCPVCGQRNSRVQPLCAVRDGWRVERNERLDQTGSETILW